MTATEQTAHGREPDQELTQVVLELSDRIEALQADVRRLGGPGLPTAEPGWSGEEALPSAGPSYAWVSSLGAPVRRRPGVPRVLLEVLFLALTLTNDLAGRYRKAKAIGLTCALAVLVPVGALIAQPVALLTPIWITGFLSFGLMALLYRVTEELLVEAHEKPDSPLISAMFFVGFLVLLLIEEIMA